jgi:hypothetical protein
MSRTKYMQKKLHCRDLNQRCCTQKYYSLPLIRWSTYDILWTLTMSKIIIGPQNFEALKILKPSDIAHSAHGCGPRLKRAYSLLRERILSHEIFSCINSCQFTFYPFYFKYFNLTGGDIIGPLLSFGGSCPH